METRVILLSIVAGFLGLLSAALGIAAEKTRIKEWEISGMCEHPTTPVIKFSIAAVVILILAQLLIVISSGCCTTNATTSTTNRAVSLFLCALSWIAFALAIIVFLLGASTSKKRMNEDGYCAYVRPGLFAGASALAIVAVSFGIGEALLAQRTTSSRYLEGVQMDQRQF